MSRLTYLLKTADVAASVENYPATRLLDTGEMLSGEMTH